jgi:hypothetical protein
VPVHVTEEGLLAAVGHLDRLASVQREQARVHVHGQVLATAERAADAGQREPDAVSRQAERGSDLLLVYMQPLGRDEQIRPAAAIRYGKPGFRAEERLVLHADRVAAGDDHIRRNLPAPLADPHVPDQVPACVERWRAGLQRRDHVGDRVADLVVNDDPRRRAAGDLRVVGSNRATGSPW